MSGPGTSMELHLHVGQTLRLKLAQAQNLLQADVKHNETVRFREILPQSLRSWKI